MFEQLVESSSGKRHGRWSYFAVTSAVWLLVTSAVIVAGVAGYDARLNDQFEMLTLVLPTPPLATPPAGPKIEKAPTVADQRPAAFESQPQAPHAIPQPSNQPPPIDFGIVGGSGSGPGAPGGDPNGVPGAIGGVPGAPSTGIAITEPPPPPPTPKMEEPKPVKQATRISRILQGTATRKVEPLYPRIARDVGVSGPVVVEVVVDERGNVISARALSGHPLLRPAAENAARGWRWNPTILNDVPVQVVGTITFNFVK